MLYCNKKHNNKNDKLRINKLPQTIMNAIYLNKIENLQFIISVYQFFNEQNFLLYSKHKKNISDSN